MASTHKHTKDCYESRLTCGQHPHIHGGPSCYKRDGSLKCTSTAHTHGPSCYSPVGPLCGHM